MYSLLLMAHSVLRWLVLLTLLYALFRGIRGWSGQRPFTRTDNTVRHNTATFAHLQLLIGYTLYYISPLIAAFRYGGAAEPAFPLRFFGWIHPLLMTVVVVLITIGSSAAKRQTTDAAKFRTMTIWFSLALLMLLVAIPWPFSPLAQRPYLRLF
ncbi:hypothetical protein [Spirosoma rhododendri]|uniref:Cytochrome B n=1 Tax=Spirosoma rhododendri TaxID=2728024 RepID=A0A7L5DLX0_9BACT|nr:hypothetical protein [Spirosoma rhododendri]QJD79474.1 hypothetical protein HH216_14460 [Spirosoma rhododendri]